MVNRFNKHLPHYEDDSDYNTNAPSYYEDLARKSKLIEMLAKKIWEYEEKLDLTISEVEKTLTDYMNKNDIALQEMLEKWDYRIDNLDKEVSHIFVEWLNDGTLEQIINHDVLGNKADQSELDKTNEQLTQIEKEGTKLSSLGLISNNKEKAYENMVIMAQALKSGIKLLVDDTYYIEQIDNQIIENKVVYLKGVDTNPSLIIIGEGSTKLFELTGVCDIFIENVRFIGDSLNQTALFSSDSIQKLGKVYIDSCTFTNGVYVGSLMTNVDENPNSGIDELYFTRNKIQNINKSFLSLNDTPVKRIVINDNIVNNFSRIFINGTVSNDSEHVDLITKNRSYIEIKNNRVTCDDDWFDDTDTWAYHCFVLWESQGDAVYDGNHVEGLKTKKDAPVYDVYLSVKNVSHTNSIFKNNLCFNANKNNATSAIIKSKGSNGGLRRYTDNTYVIEKEYVERLGESLSNAWVYFMDLISPIETFEIKNNTFNIYHMIFRAPVENVGFNVKNFLIENNTFNCTIGSGVLMSVDYYDGVDYSKSRHKIVGNDLYIDTGEIHLLRQGFRGGEKPKNKEILILGNRFYGESLRLHNSVSTEKLIIQNNYFDIKGEDNTILTFSDIFVIDYVSEGNTFKKMNGYLYKLAKFEGLSLQTNDVYYTNIPTTQSRFGLFFQKNVETKKHKYIIETKALFEEGWQKFSYSYIYGYDTSTLQNYIEFTNTDGEIIRKVVGSESTSEGVQVKNETILEHVVPIFRILDMGTTISLNSFEQPLLIEEKINSFDL